MNEAEFDTFAEEYEAMHRKNISVSGDGPEYFAEYKVKALFDDRMLRNKNSNANTICMDFGAGIGASQPYLRKYFPETEIVALDVSQKSLDINKERNGDNISYLLYDGDQIPLRDNSLDFAMSACVFHHIPHDNHHHQLREISRVLKPGGDLFIFEHNPLNPITLRAVNTCPFDENAELIRGKEMRKRMSDATLNVAGPNFQYFFPSPLKSFRPLEKYLKWLPVGAQYYVRGSKPE